MLDIALHRRRRGLQLWGARLVERELGRIDEDVGAGQVAELTHLDRCPGRLTGPRRPRTRISSHARGVDRLDRCVGRIRRRELARGQRQHPGHVERDVAVPDHDRPLVREVELEVLEIGVPVVPGDERGGRPRAGQVLAGDPEAAVGLRPERVDDSGV